MRPLNMLLATALLAVSAKGQVYQDNFSYPDGPAPGWTTWRGTWNVVGQRLRYSGGTVWGYVTKDGLAATDCVLDALCVSDPVTTVNFGGTTARHPGTTADANLLMCKLQSNTAPPTFDIAYMYERAGRVALSQTMPSASAIARCRFIVLGSQTWMSVDADLDGVWEQTFGPMALQSVFGSGLVGLSGYQNVDLDDFKFFDAVLIGQPASVPQIGTTYTMQLRAGRPQGTLFLCLASFSNAGIPVDGNRAIPLGLDGLLTLSLAAPGVFQFAGALDQNGDGAPALNIPNDPSLVGAAMYIAGVTLELSGPSPIGSISNDHRIVIQ